MGIIPEGKRQKRAAELCQLFQGLYSAEFSPEYPDREHIRREILDQLEESCAPEIISAVLKNFKNYAGAGLCGIFIAVAQKPPYTFLFLRRETVDVIHVGISRATSTVAISGVAFCEHVGACVARAIEEESAKLAKELRQLKPRTVLKWCDDATIERVPFIVEQLSEEQRAALSNLLFHELGGKPRLLPMNKEPKMPEHPTLKQRQAWLYWYLWARKMHKPETQRALGGVPMIVGVTDGDRMLVNKTTGRFADPLGPIHAPVLRALSRQMNKHGSPIKDPESERRIARSVGVSRSKLSNYPDLSIPIVPKGKDRVDYEVTSDQVLEALDASLRKKPTKSEDS